MASQGARIDRAERLLNLVICLMAARVPVRRATIREAIPGYSDAASDAAFERMFERDKDELRAMGIPIETIADVHGEVLGYRVHPEDYELPAITFTSQERAALVVAATLWESTTLGPAAISALRKLEAVQPAAIGGDEQDSRFLVRSPEVARFALPLITALRERRTTVFRYRSATDPQARERSVDPWGIVARDGGWYLVGHDRDRAEPRVFRLSRIEGAVELVGSGDVTPRPDGIDLASPILPAEAEGPTEAVVEILAGRGAELRRHAVPPLTTSAHTEARIRVQSREQLVAMLCAATDGARLLAGDSRLVHEVREAWERTLARHVDPAEGDR